MCSTMEAGASWLGQQREGHWGREGEQAEGRWGREGQWGREGEQAEGCWGREGEMKMVRNRRRSYLRETLERARQRRRRRKWQG